MEHNQLDLRPLDLSTAFDHWLIAAFTATYGELQEHLSDAHDVITDPLMTAGAPENLWMFTAVNGIRIEIVHHEPIDLVHVYADSTDTVRVLEILAPILKNREVRTASPPIYWPL